MVRSHCMWSLSSREASSDWLFLVASLPLARRPHGHLRLVCGVPNLLRLFQLRRRLRGVHREGYLRRDRLHLGLRPGHVPVPALGALRSGDLLCQRGVGPPHAGRRCSFSPLLRVSGRLPRRDARVPLWRPDGLGHFERPVHPVIHGGLRRRARRRGRDEESRSDWPRDCVSIVYGAKRVPVARYLIPGLALVQCESP